MCIAIQQDQDCKLACVQTYLDSCLSDCLGFGGHREFSEDCYVGVGGHRKFSDDCEGVGGKGPGEANGGFGGIGVELKRQDGGKGWRI